MSAWQEIAPSTDADLAARHESWVLVLLHVHRFENRSCRSSKPDSAPAQSFRKAPEGGEGRMFSSALLSEVSRQVFIGESQSAFAAFSILAGCLIIANRFGRQNAHGSL